MKNIVNVPKELLIGRLLLSEISNRGYNKIALVLLGKNMELRNFREDLSIVRLYLFMKDGGEYFLGKDLKHLPSSTEFRLSEAAFE